MTPEKDPAIALTLDRGLLVLEHVIAGTTSLDQLTAATGLSRSAVYRLLTTLARRGYLRQASGSGWSPGYKLLDLAGQAAQAIDPAGALQEAVDELADRVEDSVHIGIAQGRDVLYVAKGQGTRTIQMVSHVGLRLPAQNTALGRVLWAHGDIEAAVACFDPGLVQTEHSARTAKQFREILRETRERGYAIDAEESTIGLTCVAVPLGEARPPQAALSVSAPSAYMTPERIEELVGILREAAPAISHRFTAVRPILP